MYTYDTYYNTYFTAANTGTTSSVIINDTYYYGGSNNQFTYVDNFQTPHGWCGTIKEKNPKPRAKVNAAKLADLLKM